MLYIYTNKSLINTRLQCIDDIEAHYILNKTEIVNSYESNNNALIALENIEGMTYHDKDMIKAKFGSVALDNISTGGKGCLLLALYHNKIALSTDEMGYNCIDLICKFARNIDITIYSSAPYYYINTTEPVYVNNTLCDNEDEILDFMGGCYE